MVRLHKPLKEDFLGAISLALSVIACSRQATAMMAWQLLMDCFALAR
jgi:hypothetical protein